jgi:hypothetical protein
MVALKRTYEEDGEDLGRTGSGTDGMAFALSIASSFCSGESILR